MLPNTKNGANGISLFIFILFDNPFILFKIIKIIPTIAPIQKKVQSEGLLSFQEKS